MKLCSRRLKSIAVIMTAISLTLLIVALGQAHFLEGRTFNGSGNGPFTMGLFSSCSNYGCEHDPFSWTYSSYLKSVREQWHAYQAFLLLQVILHGVCLIVMRNRLMWAKRNPARADVIKRWLPGMQLAVTLFGAISLALVCTAKTRITNDMYWVSMSHGPSLKLQIASYPIVVVAFFLYLIGWRYEPDNVVEEVPNTPPSLHDLQPQQVAININGQIVMATITPSQLQPVPAPITYQPAPVVYLAQHPVPAQVIQHVQSPYAQQVAMQTHSYPQYSSNVQVNNPAFNPQVSSMTYPMIHPNVNGESTSGY